MNFLSRGRPVFLRNARPSEPAREPVSATPGLPAATPAPEGVTDDLSPSVYANQASVRRLEERIACVQGLGDESVGSETFLDGKPADKLWVEAELERLGELADLAEEHGPWEAAQRMWAPAPRPPADSSANVKYWATLRGAR